MKTHENRKQTLEQDKASREYIQQRAYDLYMKRGQTPGHELEDWLEAEHQVKEEQEHRVPAISL